LKVRNNLRIILVALIFGTIAWGIEAAIDFFSHPQPRKFEHFLFDFSLNELYERFFLLLCVTVSVIIALKFSARLHRAKKAIGSGERQMDAVVNSIQEGVIIKDRDYRILRVNPVVAERYQFALPLEGRRCYEAFRGRDLPCPGCPTTEALESGKPARAVVSKPGPNGRSDGWLEIYSSPLVDAATGAVTGVIETARDITTYKLAAEALRESEILYRMLVSNIPAVVFRGQADWRVEFTDDKIEDLTG